MTTTRKTLLSIINVRVHEKRTCIIGLDKIGISNYPREVFDFFSTYEPEKKMSNYRHFEFDCIFPMSKAAVPGRHVNCYRGGWSERR